MTRDFGKIAEDLKDDCDCISAEKIEAALQAAYNDGRNGEGKMNDGLKMKYFVLKPAGDDIYAEASRMAMRAYAKTIMEANPQFSKDLWDWAGNEHIAHHERKGTLPGQNAAE